MFYYLLMLHLYKIKEKEITTLEIIHGFLHNVESFTKDPSEEWIDLDGTRTVWLKISYNQRGVPPVTHLEFMYIPMEAENIVDKYPKFK